MSEADIQSVMTYVNELCQARIALFWSLRADDVKPETQLEIDQRVFRARAALERRLAEI